VSHLLQKILIQQNQIHDSLELIEQQMGREWTREMILASGFENDRSNITSGVNVLMRCLHTYAFDLLWELIEAYDLPVEFVAPPIISKTLLHVAILQKSPSDEVQAIAT